MAPEASAFRTQLREQLPSDTKIEEEEEELITELHMIATHRQLVTVFSSPLEATASNEAQATRLSDELLGRPTRGPTPLPPH